MEHLNDEFNVFAPLEMCYLVFRWTWLVVRKLCIWLGVIFSGVRLLSSWKLTLPIVDTCNVKAVELPPCVCPPVLIEDFTTQELLEDLYRRCPDFMIWIAMFTVVFHMPYYLKIFVWWCKVLKKACVFSFHALCQLFINIKLYIGFGVVRRPPPTHEEIPLLRRGSPTNVSLDIGQQTATYRAEKYVPGSEYEQVKVLPPFQVEICRRDNGAYVPVAQGFRVDNKIITATHAISDSSAQDSYIGIYHGDTLEVVPNNFVHLDNVDVSFMTLGLNVWNKFPGLKSAKVSKTLVNVDRIVSVCGRGQKSTGPLRPYHLPHVTYAGSTKPGFSGAPYVTGGTVHAIHVGAGVTNLAVDMAVVMTAINHLKEESTTITTYEKMVIEALQEAHTRGKKIKGMSWGMDDYMVNVHGRAIMVDRDFLTGHDDLWESLWLDDEDRDWYHEPAQRGGKGRGGRKRYDDESVPVPPAQLESVETPMDDSHMAPREDYSAVDAPSTTNVGGPFLGRGGRMKQAANQIVLQPPIEPMAGVNVAATMCNPYVAAYQTNPWMSSPTMQYPYIPSMMVPHMAGPQLMPVQPSEASSSIVTSQESTTGNSIPSTSAQPKKRFYPVNNTSQKPASGQSSRRTTK